jgi:hypothetical protein
MSPEARAGPGPAAPAQAVTASLSLAVRYGVFARLFKFSGCSHGGKFPPDSVRITAGPGLGGPVPAAGGGPSLESLCHELNMLE